MFFLFIFVLLFSQSNVFSFAEGDDSENASNMTDEIDDLSSEDDEVYYVQDGEDDDPCVDIDDVNADYGIWTWPVEGKAPLSNIYRGYSSGHKALDITDSEGTWILAAKDGVVYNLVNDCSHIKVDDGVCKHGSYTNGGNQVYIKHDDGTFSGYCHMIKGSITVAKGQRVTAGQRIGKMGQSGYATGVHLHFGVTYGGSTYHTGGTSLDPSTLSYNGDVIKLVTDAGKEYSGTVKFWAQRNDTDSNHHTQFFVDDVAVTGFLMSDSSGWFSFELDTTKYSNGSHKLSVEYCNTQSKWTDSATIIIKNNVHKHYKLYLDPNGGKFSDGGTAKITAAKDLIQDEGQLWNVSEYKPSRDGYTFMGWFDAKEGGIRVYNSDGISVSDGKYWKEPNYIGNQDLTVYAQWNKKKEDTENPVISKSYITDLTSVGYTVVCEATDNVGIERVCFPTWTEYNDQDDLVDDWFNNAKATSVSGNTYFFEVKISDHNNERGNYRTHIYAYDKEGNYAKVSINDIVVPEKTIVKGDLTGDGEVAMGDVVKVARAVGGYITLTPEEVAAADVTGDGEVAMGDVVKIARYVGGYIDSL